MVISGYREPPPQKRTQSFSDLRHVEMEKKVCQDSTVVKCIICFLAFNNIVTWNFAVFFNSQVVEEVKREDATRKTSVTPNLYSGNISRFHFSETSSANRRSLATFFTPYMVTSWFLPTVLMYLLNPVFGHFQQTMAPRLFVSRAFSIFLCVVQLVLLKVKGWLYIVRFPDPPFQVSRGTRLGYIQLDNSKLGSTHQ